MEISKIKFKFNKINIKKIFVSFLAAATIFTTVTPAMANQIAVNMPATIHEKENITPISSGVTHQHIQKFTTLGWWNINVLRVDLTDPFTDIQGLFSEKGISNRDRVSSMVDKSNAVAGINGDFFNYTPVGVSLGSLINKGEIISTRGDDADPLPGIFVDFMNNAKIDYLDTKTTLTNLTTGAALQASLVNSVRQEFNIPIILTPKWGEKSIGKRYNNDLVEIVVENDIVVDVRDSDYAIDIPKNGYVVVARGANGDKLRNYSVGDRLSFTMESNINIKDIKFSVGGGGYILKDGQVNKPEIAAAGNHPRTGIGISKDGKELILVTIDGRGTSFKGVGQDMFASILRSLGAYNAINLDGGGSTAMAIKPLDKDKSQVVNTPSDNGERYVVNGVGVFSNAPIDKLAYLKVSTNDNKMFPNTGRILTVKGYDKYHNPVEVDHSKLVFNYEGEKGVMDGASTFKALAPGDTTVVVSHIDNEDIKGEINLKVLGEAVDIVSKTSNLYLDTNSEVNLPMFFGIDANGVEAAIHPRDLNFEIINDLGKIENNAFHSGDKIGAGIISAKLGNGVENIRFSVGSYDILIHDFNSLDNVEFSSYPELVKGSISPGLDFKVGSSSLKLNYDFSQGDMTRAAYIDFLDGEKVGMPIKGTPTSLSLWIKGDKSGSWLRGTVLDSKGKEHIIDFHKSIDWTGWEFKTTKLPNNISYPIRLKRIYVAETNPAKKTIGEISIDGLTGGYPPNLGDLKIPSPTTFKDKSNVKKEIQNNGYSFSVAMEPKGINELVKYDALSQIKQKMQKQDLAIFLNGLSGDFAKSLGNKDFFDASGDYKGKRFKDGFFIHVDTKLYGIRATNPKQWNHLFYSINNTDKNNIFLLLDTPVWGGNGFKDTLEAEFFHEYLLENKAKGKNIFVIHGGNSNSTLLKDGIRYLGLDTRAIANPDNIYNLSSIDFVVNGSEITYQLNPMFKK